MTLAGFGTAATGAAKEPTPVPDSALDGLLLTVDEVNKVFGTTGMAAHERVAQMADNRNLLPNLNCLGVWQVNEAPIYGPSHWKAVRQQMLRMPDTDDWDMLVVQSVVSYRTADAAREFFSQSADRWSNCTNHTVNIRLNDKALPSWRSGDLKKTDDRLVMPYARSSGEQLRSCQHVLEVTANVVIDTAACGLPSPAFDKAEEVTNRIDAKFAR
jgi:hypothetical protein